MPSMIKKMSDHVGVNKNIDHAVVADFGNNLVIVIGMGA